MDASDGTQVIRPFLKWAGGKTQLLPQLRDHYPRALHEGRLRRHVEPFLGGGALFLDVAQRYRIQSAFLSDINPELVLVYRVVQKQPCELIELLEHHIRRYTPLSEDQRKRYYYNIRDEYNRQRESVDFTQYSDAWLARASNMLFMNKTCYNGLYRVNSKGDFNVPHGRYARPAILDAQNLLGASQLLQIAEIQYCGFTQCESVIDENAFVYFDPPYRPLSVTARFTSYSRRRFDDDEQRRLGRFYAHLHDEHGAKLMLSNSDPRNVNPQDDFFDDMYNRFTLHRLAANRMINSNAGRRGKIAEILVTNYPTFDTGCIGKTMN